MIEFVLGCVVATVTFLLGRAAFSWRARQVRRMWRERDLKVRNPNP